MMLRCRGRQIRPLLGDDPGVATDEHGDVTFGGCIDMETAVADQGKSTHDRSPVRKILPGVSTMRSLRPEREVTSHPGADGCR